MERERMLGQVQSFHQIWDYSSDSHTYLGEQNSVFKLKQPLNVSGCHLSDGSFELLCNQTWLVVSIHVDRGANSLGLDWRWPSHLNHHGHVNDQHHHISQGIILFALSSFIIKTREFTVAARKIDKHSDLDAKAVVQRQTTILIIVQYHSWRIRHKGWHENCAIGKHEGGDHQIEEGRERHWGPESGPGETREETGYQGLLSTLKAHLLLSYASLGPINSIRVFIFPILAIPISFHIPTPASPQSCSSPSPSHTSLSRSSYSTCHANTSLLCRIVDGACATRASWLTRTERQCGSSNQAQTQNERLRWLQTV